MKKLKLLTLGFVTSLLFVSLGHAQGLVGERYAGVEAGYSRISLPGTNLNGWGGGAGVNVPVFSDQTFGIDAGFGGDYLRTSKHGVKVDNYSFNGLVRGYVPATENVTPFADIGLGWGRSRVSHMGSSEKDDGFILPLGVGVEFKTGQFSLTPFYNYNIALKSGMKDSWTIGGTAAYWLNLDLGLTLTVSHIDLGKDVDGFTAGAGVLFRF